MHYGEKRESRIARLKIVNFMNRIKEWGSMRKQLRAFATKHMGEGNQFGQADVLDQSVERNRISLDVRDHQHVLKHVQQVIDLVDKILMPALQKNRYDTQTDGDDPVMRKMKEYTLVRATLFIDPPGSQKQAEHVDIDPSKWKPKRPNFRIWNIFVPIYVPKDSNPTRFKETGLAPKRHKNMEDTCSRRIQEGETRADILAFDGTMVHNGVGNSSSENRIFIHLVYMDRWMLFEERGRKEISEQYNDAEMNVDNLNDAKSQVGFWLKPEEREGKRPELWNNSGWPGMPQSKQTIHNSKRPIAPSLRETFVKKRRRPNPKS